MQRQINTHSSHPKSLTKALTQWMRRSRRTAVLFRPWAHVQPLGRWSVTAALAARSRRSDQEDSTEDTQIARAAWAVVGTVAGLVVVEVAERPAERWLEDGTVGVEVAGPILAAVAAVAAAEAEAVAVGVEAVAECVEELYATPESAHFLRST